MEWPSVLAVCAAVVIITCTAIERWFDYSKHKISVRLQELQNERDRLSYRGSDSVEAPTNVIRK